MYDVASGNTEFLVVHAVGLQSIDVGVTEYFANQGHSMRFALKDILLLTAAAALWATMIQSNMNLKRKRAELSSLRVEAETMKARLSAITQVQTEEIMQSRRDELDEYQKATQAALRGYENIREKYSQLQPVAGRVSFRVAPTLNSDIDFRLHIPSEFPVMLRGGIRLSSYESDNMDSANWPAIEGFQSVGPWQLQLQPGEQKIRFYTAKKNSRDHMLIEHNGDLLYEIALLEHYRASGYSHPSGTDQIDIAQERLPTILQAHVVNQNESGETPRYDLVLWLSSTPDIEIPDFKRFAPIKHGLNTTDSGSEGVATP
jgi:hypothetical protein